MVLCSETNHALTPDGGLAPVACGSSRSGAMRAPSYRQPRNGGGLAAASAAPTGSPHSAERPIDGGTLRGEEAWPLLRDVQAILEPYSEFTVDGDHGLVAEAHARLYRRRVAADEIGPFVTVHPDAMPRAVR